jgi:ABC-type proline/glycine betaine transport system permease subunit
MSPLWSVLVTIGQWAQTHQTLTLVLGGTLVLVLGLAQVVQRTASRHRGMRP